MNYLIYRFRIRLIFPDQKRSMQRKQGSSIKHHYKKTNRCGCFCTKYKILETESWECDWMHLAINPAYASLHCICFLLCHFVFTWFMFFISIFYSKNALLLFFLVSQNLCSSHLKTHIFYFLHFFLFFQTFSCF